MEKLILMLTLIAIHASSLACSFASDTSIFKPTLERWDEHPGPAQKGEPGDYWEKVPAPVVSVRSITRGSDAVGSSCADAGTITLEVSLPNISSYSIDEFAVYFRVKSGTEPDLIFPDIPLVGGLEEGKQVLFFAWLDGHPSRQIDLDLEIEAFLITNGLNVGPSSVFKIKAKKG